MLVISFTWLDEDRRAEVTGHMMEPKQNRKWVANLISSVHKTRLLINLYNKYSSYRGIRDIWDFIIHFKELVIKFSLAQTGQDWISLQCTCLSKILSTKIRECVFEILFASLEKKKKKMLYKGKCYLPIWSHPLVCGKKIVMKLGISRKVLSVPVQIFSPKCWLMDPREMQCSSGLSLPNSVNLYSFDSSHAFQGSVSLGLACLWQVVLFSVLVRTLLQINQQQNKAE